MKLISFGFALLLPVTVLVTTAAAKPKPANISCWNFTDRLDTAPFRVVADAVSVESITSEQLPKKTADGYRRFKQPLGFRTGQTITVRILKPSSARLSYGSAAATEELRYGPCEETAKPWGILIGSIDLKSPACVTLQVSGSERTEKVRLPIGAKC